MFNFLWSNIKRFFKAYPHIYVLSYAAVAFVWFSILEKVNVSPKYLLYSPIDDLIPFSPPFVIPYVLWYLYMTLPYIYFGFKAPKEFVRLAHFMFGGMLVACAIYTIFPNGQQLRPLMLDNDIFSRIIAWLYSTDTPTNSAPSIHVINSIAVHASVWHYPKFGRAVKLSSLILCVLICMSTVFVKQHSVLCIFSALIVCGVLYVVLYRKELLTVFKKKPLASSGR